MWRSPNRPNHAISISYNDGIAEICRVDDVAEVGRIPVPHLTTKYNLMFCEKRVGINRYYSARQNQIDIERVIRVQTVPDINTTDICVIAGIKYRIDQVQKVEDSYPPSLDLSLVRYTQGVER